MLEHRKRPIISFPFRYDVLRSTFDFTKEAELDSLLVQICFASFLLLNNFSVIYVFLTTIYPLGGGMEDILSHIFGGFGGGMFGKWIFVIRLAPEHLRF